MVWTVMNWVGVKSMARTAMVWVGGSIGFGRRLGKLAGYDFRGVLVHFWKKEGNTSDEKKGQTKQESGLCDVDQHGPYTGVLPVGS
jgi:hypothetical protein